jgi:hypothetical protein
MTARRATPALALGIAGLALSAGGCGSKYPPERQGGIISGHVTYAGAMTATLARPTLRVVATIDFPPSGQPHGIVQFDRPILPGTVAFELRNLPVWRYKIIAQLFDADHPAQSQAASPLPFGGWPNFCALGQASSLVESLPDAPVHDIDFTIYDQSGGTDPCARGGDVCPNPGTGSLRTEIRYARAAADIAPADRLIFVLLTPTNLPAAFSIVEPKDLKFPFTVVSKNLAPGPYKPFVCYDVGGMDYLRGCDPMQDAIGGEIGGGLELAADRVTSIQVDLDLHTAAVAAVDDPKALGCP